MSNTNDTRNLFQVVQEMLQKLVNFISGAVSRIFGPRDDNYPTTGVQPFEGEPAPKKHY